MSLEFLPNEILESIITLLPLSDIRNLRLASLTLSTKCTQDHFKSYFRSKIVDLTENCLQSFVQLTKEGSLGCLVENLIITGIVYNTIGLEALLRKKTRTITERNGPMFMSTERKCESHELTKAEDDLKILRASRAQQVEVRESRRDVELLAEALKNVSRNGKAEGLRKLVSRVVVYRNDAEERLLPARGGAWKLVWKCAAETYHAVFAALAASELRVEELVLFNDEESRRCSIGRNEISKVNFEAPGLVNSLAAVKSLSVSLSDRLIDENDRDTTTTGDPADEIDWSVEAKERDEEVLKAEAVDESNFSGFTKLIGCCTQLEELDVHYYRLRGYIIKMNDCQVEEVFRRVVEATADRTMNLTTLRLRGLTVRAQDLLAFLQRAPIQNLTLENIFLTDGETLESIFRYATSEQAGMEKLYFDDLFEQKLLYFDDEPGGPKFPSMGGSSGANTLHREGTDVRQSIKYHMNDGRPLGSPSAYVWREKRRAEYGPP